MDTRSPAQLHLTAWMVMNLLCVFSHEVTVNPSDLMKCDEDKRVCVTDRRDCGPPPAAPVQKFLNMSCYFLKPQRSLTCTWSEESDGRISPDVSLILRSKSNVRSCSALLNLYAILNVTARIRADIWSQPHAVVIRDSVKPSQPVLTVLGRDADAVNVSWRSSEEGDCRLRYRVIDTRVWSQTDFIPIHGNPTLTYRIQDLLPSTVYRAAVACRRNGSRIWSDWSSDVAFRTLDRVPSRPPQVCYRVEKTAAHGSLILHLLWKDLNNRNTGDHILGYRVSYEPSMTQLQKDAFIQNVTNVAAHLVVAEGNCSVTVTAFNTAGCGPAARLSIDTQRQIALPPVRNLWIYSLFPAVKGLQVRWESPAGPRVSYFVIGWQSATRPSISRWTTEDGNSTSTVIQDVVRDEFKISVLPVYIQQCGSPLSLSASLEQGALVEAVDLKVLAVTTTTVTVAWAWRRKSGSRVNAYKIVLRDVQDIQTLSLWPDQRLNHTLLNLTSNTEYLLHLMADDKSVNILPVRTDYDKMPVVATVTPLLLLTVTAFIISILSRTVYKSYFFPRISSPRGSTTGQWLMEPNHQKTGEKYILDIENFQVTDVLGEKSVIVVGPSSQRSSAEDVHEALSIGHLIGKLSALEMVTDYISDAQLTAEHQLVSLRSYHPDRQPDVFMREENRAALAPLLLQTRESDGRCPHEERQVDFSKVSHQKVTAAKLSFHEFMANVKSCGVHQTACVTDYIMNPPALGKTQSSQPYLVSETDYLPWFHAQTEEKENANT